MKKRKQKFDVTYHGDKQYEFVPDKKKKRKPQDAVVSNVKRLRAEVRAYERRTRALEQSLGKLARAHAELADHVDVVVAAIDTRMRTERMLRGPK